MDLPKQKKCRIKDSYYYIISSPVRISFFLLCIFSAAIVLFCYCNSYYEKNFYENILVECHGLLFDLLVIGVVLTYFTAKGDKETEIKQCKQELQTYKHDGSKEAINIKEKCIKILCSKYKITDIDLSFCILSEANLSSTPSEIIDLSHSNFSNATLTKVKFESAYLQNSNFNNAELKGANLTNTHLQHSDFTDANLNEANLTGARLEFSIFKNSKIERAFLINANMKEAKLQKVNLKSTELNDADLTGAHINNSILDNVLLNNAKLQNSIIEKSNLNRSFLINANMKYARLKDTSLQFVVLKNADLIDTKFGCADLNFAEFDENTDVKGASFTGTILKNISTFHRVKNLTFDQLKDAYTIFNSKFNDDISEEIDSLEKETNEISDKINNFDEDGNNPNSLLELEEQHKKNIIFLYGDYKDEDI